MIRLLSLLVLLLGINTLSAQIKVIDKVSKNISKHRVNTVYEMKADELEDNRIKISFRSDTSGIDDYGEIYLNSMDDFEDLYAIINKGFEEKKNQTIKIDLGDSILAIYFFKPFVRSNLTLLP